MIILFVFITVRSILLIGVKKKKIYSSIIDISSNNITYFCFRK